MRKYRYEKVTYYQREMTRRVTNEYHYPLILII